MQMLTKFSVLAIVGVSSLALAAPTPSHIGTVKGFIQSQQGIAVQAQSGGRGSEVIPVPTNGVDFTWPNLVSPEASMTVAYSKGPRNFICKLSLSKPLLKNKKIEIEVSGNAADSTAFCQASNAYTQKLVEHDYLTIKNAMPPS